MSKAWKDTERAIAQRLGGRRVGNSGRNTEDVAHRWLSIEAKERESLPAWLKAAVAQARANAPAGRLPLAILHELGARHDGDFVVLTLRDFQEWFGDVPPGDALRGRGAE
jgi:hypothetical protein